MKKIRFRLLIICLILFIHSAAAGKDRGGGSGAGGGSGDNMIVYPDGDYGIDLGGGYQIMPSKETGKYEMILPVGYREDYQDTRYGAMVGNGFINFPGFSLDKKADKDKEKDSREKEFIFHEATTISSSENVLWGFSDPVRRK